MNFPVPNTISCNARAFFTHHLCSTLSSSLLQKKAHRRSKKSKSDRRRDAKTAKNSPVSFAAVPKARTSSSMKVKAAEAARDSNASTLRSRSLRGRRSRDKAHDALMAELGLEEISTMLDNKLVPGDGKKVAVFYCGSHEGKPTTFPDHARGENVIVQSVHEMKQCGGEDGCFYTAHGNVDPDIIVCPLPDCLSILGLDSHCDTIQNLIAIIKAHPGTTNRHCMIVSDSKTQ